MKVLILSWGTGGGYTKAAAAIREKLEEHGHGVTVLDLRQFEREKVKGLEQGLLIHRTVSRNIGGVQRFLEENAFDVILMTHVIPALILSALRTNLVALPEMIYVVSDYSCAAFTEDTCCDCYVLPSEKLEGEFCRRGIPREKLLAAGIPVSKEYLTGMSRQEAREQLGLSREGRYLLLSGEGVNMRVLMRAMRTLESYLEENGETRVLVTGLSYDAQQRFQTDFGTNPRFSLVTEGQNQAMYKGACDVMIGAASGVSCAEAAVLGLPLIHLAPSGGIERKNSEFYARYGMSIPVKGGRRQLRSALKLLEDEAVCEQIKKAQQIQISGLAAAQICNRAEAPGMQAGAVGLLV